MDPLSNIDQLTSLWRIQDAWTRLHPEADALPDTLTTETTNRFASFLSGLQSLLDTHRTEIAAVPTPAPTTAGEPTGTSLSAFASKGGRGQFFVELRSFAEAPEWVNILPEPAVFDHPWFGPIVITAERNERFVQNYNDRVYGQDIPVDAEHETKLSGAFGWVRELRLNADFSVDARIEWTPRGIAAFENEAFRYVSPEWYDVWEQPMTGEVYEDVLVGLALTNHPFFKESALEPVLPLVATEAGLTVPERAAATPADASPQPTKGGTPMGNLNEQTPDAAQPVALTEADLAAFREWQANRDEMARQMSEMQAQITALSERNASLEAANAAAAREAMIRRFTDEVMGRTDESRHRWVGDADKHVAVLVAMAESVGEDSEAFRDHVALQRTAAEQVATGELFASIGTTEGQQEASAYEQLAAQATKYANEHGVTFAAAFAEVVSRKENADLYRQYQATR